VTEKEHAHQFCTLQTMKKGQNENVSIKLLGIIICLRCSFYTYHIKLRKQIHDLSST